ncbi:ABC transporter ATP-binding protein [Flexivirga endophytica]|uniref:ABC transporter ATP-binding protein n=1 Tax=Flexivirga endophytica TaxID=1849103 RepID=A0A916SSN7_9MICO|nr:ATP-binding cassette domain-containing protein [Flexivirga endophytica]GGB14560.1 ABC transporter ATP-binding protein [Flexivirga endophytica]GHB65707.1 ABC transporter ATP-binding protein [Flexivirga endophytica]
MPPSAATDEFTDGAGDRLVGAALGSALAIETRGLTKVFGAQRAVDGIDLQVPTGSVYGFLGPNGSGKTTTIRMLLGLVSPTDGDHEILGHPMPQELTTALHRVGSLIEGPAFHSHLSGLANLRRLDAADARSDASSSERRVHEALDRVGLKPAANKRFRTYSLGMKQRLAIAAALLAPRDLLVLDEPTNGLDPQGTREVRHLVSTLAAEGITVLISSHLLGEIQQICSHVGVMRAGQLVAQGSIEELRATQTAQLVVHTPDPRLAAEVLTRVGVAAVRYEDEVVTGEPGAEPPERISAALADAGIRLRRFAIDRPSLEDLYVSLTGEGFEVRS